MTRRFWLAAALSALLFPTTAPGTEKKNDPPLAPAAEGENPSAAPIVIPSVFALELAKTLEVPADKITKVEKHGFGRTEIITLALISKRSDKKWDDLVIRRHKGAPLRRLAEEAGLNYNDLFVESESLRKSMAKTIEGGATPEKAGAGH